ncbi:VTT domain-containing protein [Paenibacillus sp. D2_2]|uniref:TVP38/TMEM64 family protein n=1 Tax=Paenibacillus sp. D2_2 TaxID=3073092 RepID=UPI0028152479|nr:VTT domain-containing protein [Paenibacillus sp. D2_2]WMT38942.1 VTT domain-containing protein [Paenibacillus sp. D2_2]
MNAWIEQWTNWLIEATQLGGFSILIITIPLSLLQGTIGIFPFATIVMLHISVLGIKNGLIASWIAGAIAGMIVYLLCGYLFSDWFNRKWMHKLQKYEKWQRGLERYGVWGVIFLRTLPIMPNNLISFMSAISNIKMSSYAWSNMIGNLSGIWLYGILSASVLFPNTDLRKLIFGYIIFLVALSVIFWFRNRNMIKRDRSMSV